MPSTTYNFINFINMCYMFRPEDGQYCLYVYYPLSQHSNFQWSRVESLLCRSTEA